MDLFSKQTQNSVFLQTFYSSSWMICCLPLYLCRLRRITQAERIQNVRPLTPVSYLWGGWADQHTCPQHTHTHTCPPHTHTHTCPPHTHTCPPHTHTHTHTHSRRERKLNQLRYDLTRHHSYQFCNGV